MSSLDGNIQKLEAALSATLRDLEKDTPSPEHVQRLLVMIDKTSRAILRLSQRISLPARKPPKGLDKNNLHKVSLETLKDRARKHRGKEQVITLLTLIASGLINVLPLFINLFNGWMNIKKEIKLRELEIDLAKTNIQAKKDLAEIAAALREGVSLRDHDSSLDDKGFIGGLRASVRPVITYSFFLLFMVIKSLSIYKLVALGGVPILEALPLIWDENTQAIFGAILGFWFGSRAIEKFGYRSTTGGK